MDPKDNLDLQPDSAHHTFEMKTFAEHPEQRIIGFFVTELPLATFKVVDQNGSAFRDGTENSLSHVELTWNAEQPLRDFNSIFNPTSLTMRDIAELEIIEGSKDTSNKTLAPAQSEETYGVNAETTITTTTGQFSVGGSFRSETFEFGQERRAANYSAEIPSIIPGISLIFRKSFAFSPEKPAEKSSHTTSIGIKLSPEAALSLINLRQEVVSACSVLCSQIDDAAELGMLTTSNGGSNAFESIKQLIQDQYLSEINSLSELSKSLAKLQKQTQAIMDMNLTQALDSYPLLKALVASFMVIKPDSFHQANAGKIADTLRQIASSKFSTEQIHAEEILRKNIKVEEF